MNVRFIQYVNSFVSINDQQAEYIISQVNKRVIGKKIILLKQGEICTFDAFIVSGLVKSYFIDNNGIEVILTFACENWWISDLLSFEEKVPSRMFIETIEDTELLIFTPSTKENIIRQVPQMERMFRLMVQRHLATYQERLFGIIAQTAEERYDVFLAKYPTLPQRIPQHLIASYLGISAEFLSRIRTRKLKKK